MAITGQARRRRIILNADAYISSATSNVPVLVKFNSTSHPDLFGTGDDKDSVWFSSDASGQTILYHEGVVFDTTNAIFYVKVDLSSTADTTIYFWYGTPSITGTESASDVWTNGYNIYHFEGGNANATSSITNGKTLTKYGTITTTTGTAGSGITGFTDSNYFYNSSFAWVTNRANFGDGKTAIVWYKTSNWASGKNFINHERGFFAEQIGSGFASRARTSDYYSGERAVSTSSTDWNMYVFLPTSSTYSITYCIGGSVTSTGTTSTWTGATFSNDYIYVGRSAVGGYPNQYGTIDELWYFTDLKSVDWVTAVYNNVYTYATFVTIDGAVSIGSSPKMICPVWATESGTAYEDTVEFTVNVTPSATATLTDVETITFTETILFSQSSGYLEGFSKRIELTIDSSKVDSDLTNFPILIKLSSSSGISDSDLSSIFTELGANSKKIAVTTSNNTQCYVEIERWDNANNLAILWAKIPSIDDDTDTTLYLYYDSSASDNSTYVGDTNSEVAENVWDANFKAVYHLNEIIEETPIRDSTSNDADFDTVTLNSVERIGDVKIGKGYNGSQMASNTNLVISSSNPAVLGLTWTFSFWLEVPVTQISPAICLLYDDTNTCFFNLQSGGSEGGQTGWNNNYTMSYSTFNFTGKPHFVVVRRNGSEAVASIYVDGNNLSATGTLNDTTPTIKYLSASGQYQKFDLDEVRISGIARSDAWIKADYYSQDDNLITYGSFEILLQSISVKFILTHEATETVTFTSTEAKTDVEVIEFTVNVSSEVIDLDEVVPFTANYSFTVEAILSHTQTVEFTETATFAVIKDVTDVELVEFGVTATATVLPTQLSSLIEFTETATFAAAKTTIDVEVIEFAANVSMDVFEGSGTQDLVEFAVNPSFEIIAVFEYAKTVEFSGIYGLITPSLALNLTPIEFQEVASFKVMDVELIKFSATVTFEAAKTVTDIEVIEFSAVFTPSVTEMDEILNFTVTATPSVTAVLTDIEVIEFAATATFEASKPLIDVEVIEFSATFTPEIETYQAELIEFTVTATPKEIVNFPSPYPDWKYRKSKEIIGSNNALTDYQMKLTLHYGSGTDDDDNVYLNSHSKTDFSDIRFSHDSVALDYFIEDKVDEDYAIVWIEIDSISTSGETIYISYGNASAADESSGENTFVDFAGSSITSYSETPNLDPSGKFRYRARLERYSAPVGNPYDTYFGLKNTDGSQYLKFQLMWDTSLHRVRYWAKRTAEWAAVPISLDSSSIQKFTLIKNEDGVYFYSDNGGTYALIEYWYTNYIPNATLGLFYYDNEEYLGITWAFLAKYTDTEPTFSTTGEEEQSGLTDRDNIDLFWILSTLEITVAATTSFEINSWSILIEFTVTATFESHYPIFDVELIEFSATFETKISYAKIYVDLDELKVESISVNKSIQDATWNCDITIDGTETISFFRHVTVEIPDHNSVSRVVFVGFIPTSNHVLASVTNKSKATAYDYSWYLSVQQMPDEYLITNAEPSTIILALLGGEDWETVTGINPYQLIEVEDWATITKTFIWDRKTTKHQAIQEICEYIGYIFLIKWKLISGFYYPIAYFVPKDDIDTYLDLPSPITITSGVSDQHVIEGISIENTQVESVNRVIVKGIDAATGTYYSSTKESLSVTDKEEIPIEIYYESADLNTQEKADDKAEEIYNLLQEFPKTYDVQLINRTDLELYQKIKFVGYSQIDEVYYRIISINYSKIGINTKVSIKLAKDDDLSNLANILRNNSGDFTNNITKIVDSRLDSMPTVAIGRILAINGSVATVELEDGSGNIEARLLNQT